MVWTTPGARVPGPRRGCHAIGSCVEVTHGDRADRTPLQPVEPRLTPRDAATDAPAAPEFEPRDEVAGNHARMIGVQRLTLMAMLPTRMSNVAGDAGRPKDDGAIAGPSSLVRRPARVLKPLRRCASSQAQSAPHRGNPHQRQDLPGAVRSTALG